MDETAIYAALTEIFHHLFDDPALVLTAETNADDVAGWDSLKCVLILVAVEERFAIRFHTTEIDELKSVGDLVQLIKKKSARP